MAIKDDVISYLIVLNSPEIIALLTVVERRAGRANLMGCLSRLMEVLEKDMEVLEKDVPNSDYFMTKMHTQIKYREYLNAHKMLPVGHPELVAATEAVSLLLFDYLRGNYVTPEIKKEFIGKLDAELTRILEG